MVHSLDFNTLKKQYMTVKLADEKKTVLLLTPPTKGIFDEFIALKNIMESDENDQSLDEMYSVCAKILSQNKGGIKVTKDKIAKLLDFEDILVFIQAYTEYIESVTNSKN